MYIDFLVYMQDAFATAGQVTELREAVKWGTDYMIKAHVATDQFYCQVQTT